MPKDKSHKPPLDVRIVESQRRPEKATFAEPFYPILKIEELPPTEDLRGELPSRMRNHLRPEEKVVHIRNYEHVWPARSVSALEVCMKAARARHAEQIGYNGPTVASVNLSDGSREKSAYEKQHGRDDLQTATDLYPLFPKLLDATIHSLAESQGVEDEPYKEGVPHGQEKVGSIILVDSDHEDSTDHKFTTRLGWKFPFYGSVDAPLSFINAIALRCESDPSYLLKNTYRSRDPGRPEFALAVAFERSVQWMKENADYHQGLVAYKNPIKGGGIRHQGWRDSSPAMVHSNGDWASDEYGIAPIEVQGLAFDAYRNAAKIYREVYNDPKKAAEFDERAWELQKQVIESGFVGTSDGGYFASGFDWGPNGQLRPIETATSAMGRLLGSGLVRSDNPEAQEKVRQTISTLFSPGMITRWGVRTLHSKEVAYYDDWYHLGTSWGYDSNENAKNLSTLGHFGLDRILGATTTYQHQETGVFYEHVSGEDSEKPIIPSQDVYVYNQLHEEMYLSTRIPEGGQTWSASSELAKVHRYGRIPLHATDPKKLAFEKRIWKGLPDSVQRVVTLFEPDLAIALQS
jgi:hypothetical protein